MRTDISYADVKPETRVGVQFTRSVTWNTRIGMPRTYCVKQYGPTAGSLLRTCNSAVRNLLRYVVYEMPRLSVSVETLRYAVPHGHIVCTV